MTPDKKKEQALEQRTQAIHNRIQGAIAQNTLPIRLAIVRTEILEGGLTIRELIACQNMHHFTDLLDMKISDILKTPVDPPSQVAISDPHRFEAHTKTPVDPTFSRVGICCKPYAKNKFCSHQAGHITGCNES